jgi:DNA-binding beta-propeller fold protein YncE
MRFLSRAGSEVIDMFRALRPLTVCAFTLLLAATSLWAQGPRLRPMAAIYVDALGAGLQGPEAVAVGDRTKLVVADSGNRRLLVYEFTDESATPQSEIRIAQVQYPLVVRIDSRGEILALDGKSSRIARISPEGDFKSFVEFPRVDRQQQMLVRSFDLGTNDHLFVLSVSEDGILELDPTDTELRRITIPPEVGFLSDLTVTSTGVVFAIDSVNKQVFAAWKDSETLEALTEPMPEDMAFPTAIAADSFGNLFVVDTTGGGIVILGQNGAFKGRQSAKGWKVGFLRHPTGLAVGGDYLFVADRSNNRVQRFEIVQ